jgi:hypothetical protein
MPTTLPLVFELSAYPDAAGTAMCTALHHSALCKNGVPILTVRQRGAQHGIAVLKLALFTEREWGEHWRPKQRGNVCRPVEGWLLVGRERK